MQWYAPEAALVPSSRLCACKDGHVSRKVWKRWRKDEEKAGKKLLFRELVGADGFHNDLRYLLLLSILLHCVVNHPEGDES